MRAVILKAEPLDPSFKWHGHKPERRMWRRAGIGLLLATAVGGSFYVGRLSTAAPVPTQQQAAGQQQATSSVGSVTQGQGAPQSDAAAAIRSSTLTPDAKAAVKEETKANAAASSAETPRAQSAAATDKGSSTPPVVLINPSTADKAASGEATRKAVPKAEPEPAAKAAAKTETRKAADDSSPAPASGKRQAKSQPPPHANAAVHQESAVRRDDPYVAPRRDESFVGSRRDDSFVASRRDDAYVPPRVSQSTLSDQRERYEGVARDDDRARFEQPYAGRRYPEPDPRYAEDVPPRRDVYEDSRGYLRPFQGARDFREYRRFDDDGGAEPYADRRPVLRPMYGGPVY
jgi:hypothetical protein